MPKKQPQEAVAWPEFAEAQRRWRQQQTGSLSAHVDPRVLLNEYRRAARALIRELGLL